MTDSIRTYRHLPHGESVPEGAKVVSTFEGQHHRRFGVLIEIPSLDPGASGSAGRAGR